MKLMLSISRLIIIFILSFSLTLTWTPETLGQVSLFSPPNNETNTQTPPWDLNKAYTCGRFWCSDVYIHDDTRQIESSLLTPELTLATPKNLDDFGLEVAQLLEKRADVIQQTFNTIVQNIINNQPISDIIQIKDWKFWLPTSIKEIWNPTPIKPLHPWTPNLEIGTKNNQTVVFIPNQFDLGIASQSIVTVTEVDAKANGMNVETLAKNWQNTIRISFSNAFWGYEFNRQYPQGRWIISGIFMATALLCIALIEMVRNFLRKWDNGLRKKLKNLTESITFNPEAATSNNLNSQDYTIPRKPDNTPLKKSRKNKNKIVERLVKILKLIKINIKKNPWLYKHLSRSKAKMVLDQQNIIKQKRNFSQLLLRLSLILQILSFMAALIAITLMFRQTRFLSVYILIETINIMFLWMGLIIVDKISDFLTDYYLNRWAIQIQSFNPNSNRYTLRVNTYSIILKQGTTFITILLGIYGSLWFIGINPSILAGAGILTVAIAFLSRNLLEDMLNGMLILCTDRYAIGDVVDIGGGINGLVENINLFVTSLRNLDGQVIAIPNSKITTVINNTKEWSRVNFTIKIAWNEDIKKAITIMIQVAKEMQNEPEWGNKFLEPLEVLGVDEVSHEGILIHILIKTLPSEHWAIGREFRLRVKQAFDEVGISLGIPHHKISVFNSSDNNDQSLTYFFPKEDN